MSSRFVHLHVHSHYSLLSALPKVDELVDAAKAAGMQALALTDNGNLYGAIEFYKECKKQEIKPIIGVDCYMAARTRHDKQTGVDNRRQRLVLLAKNTIGYKNLLRLVTDSYLEGFYYKPRVDRELLEKYAEGLVCISPSFSGDIVAALKAADEEKALELVKYYQKVFGADTFFLELTHHPEIPNHEEAMEKLVAFSKRAQVPLVAAHDVYYLSQDDRLARETLQSIQQNGDALERGGFEDAEENFSFISGEAAEKLFKSTPEAIENSAKIAEMCDIEITLGKWVFPDFALPAGITSADEALRQSVEQGFFKRGFDKKYTDAEQLKKVRERIEYELSVIKTKGYAPYFLVVADLLRHAHEQGILTTIRGSVAGSLATYLAGITNVDPLEYHLPFERFLNPERPSAPDIDMDYADNRRDEMLEYAKQKYGYEKVAQIGTFGTMMARGSVRDVARALGYPYTTGDRIAKLIPMGSQGMPMTIAKAMELEPELQKIYDDETEVREIIDTAKKIEGRARHISVHAAGVVMAPTTLTDFVPLQIDPKSSGDGSGGKIITQYDMWSVEDAGLLKFDFLGIRNLAILADAVKLAKKIENADVDIEHIPLDDTKTFKMLARGETIGLFQLNGSGMTRFLKELRPSTIHDINAMVALYRPGPMEVIPQYIERKHNPALVTYLDPRMKEYLGFSYGLLVYQDDVLLTAIKLAGYSWLEADKFRKAMGKKIPEVMQAEKDKLMKGLLEHGMSPQKAETLWKLIEPFAAYGFNKAHAASYGRVAYQTAYMKANFPAVYMCAVLTAESGNIETIAETIAECIRMKIPVLPPDINESFGGFTVIKNYQGAAGADAIRFGLYTIKNVGEGIADAIIAERKAGGTFQSLTDFLTRVKDRNLNRKSLEALIKAGALDELPLDETQKCERGQLLGNIDDLLAYSKEAAAAGNGEDSLFTLMSDTSSVPTLRLKPAAIANPTERLAWEKELLGLYVSGHPLDAHREKLEAKQKDGTTSPIARLKEMPEGASIVAYGLLEEVKQFSTKKNEKMLFIKIADYTGSMEGVVFPKTLKQYPELFMPDACIAVKGRLSKRNDAPSIVIEKAKAL